jgi:hypothetical protein
MTRQILDDIAEVTDAKSKTGTLDLSLAEQCFLISNIKTIAHNEASGVGSSGALAGGSSVSLHQQNFLNNRVDGNLKGFVSIIDKDPNSFISKIKRSENKKHSQSILSMSNLQIAGLSPKVRLYKIVRNADKKEIVEGEIPFISNSKASILTTAQGRGDDVQIENVNFDFKNQNPFGAGRIVDVRMDIVMKNGYSLSKIRKLKSLRGLGVPPNKADSKLGLFKFTDLFMRDTAISASRFEGLHYQIRANLGWEYEGRSSLGNASKSKSALESQEISLLLELANYNINFRQDGKFVVSLEFLSHMEMEADDYKTDIFASPFGPTSDRSKSDPTYTIVKELREYQQELTQLEFDLVGIQVRVADTKNAIKNTSAFATINNDLLDEQLKSYQSQESNLKSEIDITKNVISSLRAGLAGSRAAVRAQVARDKTVMYASLLKNIFEKNRMYSFSIDRNDLIFYSPQFEQELIAQREDLANFALNELARISQDVIENKFFVSAPPPSVDYASTLNTQLLTAMGNQQNADVTTASPQQFMTAFRDLEIGGSAGAVSFFAANLREGIDFTGGPRAVRSVADIRNPDLHEIYWFYYGDLVRAALEINNTIDVLAEKKMGIMLGNIGYVEDRGSFAVPLSGEDYKVNINLAHIPITVERFYSFMKKFVIDKGKTRYTVMEFMKDTISQLVVPTINTRCFGRGLQHPVKVKSTFVEALMSDNDVSAKRDPILNEYGNSDSCFVAADAVVKSIRSKEQERKRSSMDKRYTYLLSYGHSKDMALGPDFSGERTDDHKSGIWHLDLRKDTGLVKDVKFTKRAIKYLAEATVYEQSQASDDTNMRMWNVFDVEVEMVGNNLFRPGSLLYISTSASGLGDSRDSGSTASIMGLGGYYLVIDVSNQLVSSGAGKWTTIVKAIWQNSGYKKP